MIFTNLYSKLQKHKAGPAVSNVNEPVYRNKKLVNAFKVCIYGLRGISSSMCWITSYYMLYFNPLVPLLASS